MPVVGFLSSGSPRTFVNFLKAFHAGLSDEGFVRRRNVAIVYRWAEGHFDELDALAIELVAEGAAVIAATGGVRSAEAAKTPPRQFLCVFVIGFDPVKVGLVASFDKHRRRSHRHDDNYHRAGDEASELVVRSLTLACATSPFS